MVHKEADSVCVLPISNYVFGVIADHLRGYDVMTDTVLIKSEYNVNNVYKECVKYEVTSLKDKLKELIDDNIHVSGDEIKSQLLMATSVTDMFLGDYLIRYHIKPYFDQIVKILHSNDPELNKAFDNITTWSSGKNGIVNLITKIGILYAQKMGETPFGMQAEQPEHFGQSVSPHSEESNSREPSFRTMHVSPSSRSVDGPSSDGSTEHPLPKIVKSSYPTLLGQSINALPKITKKNNLEQHSDKDDENIISSLCLNNRQPRTKTVETKLGPVEEIAFMRMTNGGEQDDYQLPTEEHEFVSQDTLLNLTSNNENIESCSNEQLQDLLLETKKQFNQSVKSQNMIYDDIDKVTIDLDIVNGNTDSNADNTYDDDNDYVQNMYQSLLNTKKNNTSSVVDNKSNNSPTVQPLTIIRALEPSRSFQIEQLPNNNTSTSTKQLQTTLKQNSPTNKNNEQSETKSTQPPNYLLTKPLNIVPQTVNLKTEPTTLKNINSQPQEYFTMNSQKHKYSEEEKNKFVESLRNVIKQKGRDASNGVNINNLSNENLNNIMNTDPRELIEKKKLQNDKFKSVSVEEIKSKKSEESSDSDSDDDIMDKMRDTENETHVKKRLINKHKQYINKLNTTYIPKKKSK
jgi:hypothetical protein